MFGLNIGGVGMAFVENMVVQCMAASSALSSEPSKCH
jgi:hypothetical protein